MRWFDIKDKEPEDDICSYIVSDGNYTGIGFWCEEEFICTEGFLNKVTHWMPLPEPPNPEQIEREKEFYVKKPRCCNKDMSAAISMKYLDIWFCKSCLKEVRDQ